VPESPALADRDAIAALIDGEMRLAYFTAMKAHA
jgi:hypothetical protein